MLIGIYNEKYVVVAALASLWLMTSPASATSQPPKNTIWEYKGDGGKPYGKCVEAKTVPVGL